MAEENANNLRFGFPLYEGEEKDNFSSLINLSPPIFSNPLFWESPIGIVCQSLDGGILKANPAFENLLGYTERQLRRLDCRAISHPEDFATELRLIQQTIHGMVERQAFQKRYLRRNGETVWTEVTMSLVGKPVTDDSYLLIFVRDLSYIRRAEKELQKRRQWEALLGEIAATIRSTFDFQKILEIAVKQLRIALNTDRVVAYHLRADRSGICAAEAVEPAYPTLWGRTFSDECIPTSYLKAYCEGRLWHTADIYTENLSICHRQMLEEMKVRSMMAVPIQQVEDRDRENHLIGKAISLDGDLPNQSRLYEFRPLWGLIIVHHCRGPRYWTGDEQQLVQAVANQVAIALEQSIRVQQLQAYAQELEERVKERTYSLERSLKFEQLSRELTKNLYQEGLEEDQMLQAAVQGLVNTLKVDGVFACLLDRQQVSLEVRCQHFNNLSTDSVLSYEEQKNGTRSTLVFWGRSRIPIDSDNSLVGTRLPLLDLPENYRALLMAGKTCFLGSGILPIGSGENLLGDYSRLDITSYQTVSIAPIWDGQLIGAIFLVMKVDLTRVPLYYQLPADEVQLLEQVSNQCAIAIRQSRTWRRLQTQNQELAALNRLKGELIANTSHELRTPLTAILGFSSVLLQECFGQLNFKQKEYVDRISNSGQHLLEVINDILDLSRIEAGRLELELQIVFIAEIVESAISLIREKALEQGLSLEVEIDPNVEYFTADARRLRQMLLNLLSNAVKFTTNGKVGLKVYLSRQISDGGAIDLVNFLVWDTGIGIDPAQQGQLFSPFSQIDSSLSRRYSGTGLGLAITRKLAELHGGWITLESKKGQGARFLLTLPFYPSSRG